MYEGSTVEMKYLTQEQLWTFSVEIEHVAILYCLLKNEEILF